MTIEEMREIKETRGYSLSMLSEYSGVPLGTVQKVFSGASANPRKATLDALEKVLSGTETLYQGKSMNYEKNSKSPKDPDLQEVPAVKEAFSYNAGASRLYTTEDYFLLPEDRRAELIDGVFYDMAAPYFVHQDISGYLYSEIYRYIKDHKGTCKVLAAPSAVQLDCDDKTMVEPDIHIVCDRKKLRRFGTCGAPDFVLEILSPSTRKKDLTLKLYKYYNAGVREYWVIDPSKKVLITYDFTDAEYIPNVHPLEGEAGISIFDGDLKISLSDIAAIIREADELEE